jgi:hypothetical protein
MSSRRRRLILLVPSFHCSTIPASRRTRKWWVRGVAHGQFGDDAAALRIAQRVEDGGEVEVLAGGRL